MQNRGQTASLCNQRGRLFLLDSFNHMKKFDWDFAAKQNSKERLDFYRANLNNPISEEFFVAHMLELKKSLGRTGSNYCPSHLKAQYQNLKSNFGFFK